MVRVRGNSSPSHSAWRDGSGSGHGGRGAVSARTPAYRGSARFDVISVKCCGDLPLLLRHGLCAWLSPPASADGHTVIRRGVLPQCPPRPAGSRPGRGGSSGTLPLRATRRWVVSTEANKALVRRFYEEIDKGNLAAMDELV